MEETVNPEQHTHRFPFELTGSRFRRAAPLLLALVAACNGQIGGPGGEDTGPGPGAGSGGVGEPEGGQPPEDVLASPFCQTPQPGAAPLRRLSNDEYTNTLKDLFAGVPGVASTIDAAVATFPNEPESLGFRNNAAFLTVGSLVAQKYLDAAEQIAAVAAKAPGLVSCDPAALGEIECARDFIRTFGAKAYRRPLTEAEVQSYEERFTAGADGYTFQDGIEWVVFSMLQSPNVLYRVELGEESAGDVTEPTPYEMASRLSYLLWQSQPDEELARAAAADELATPDQIEAQVRRMLADPKAERLFEYFDQWLDIDLLSGMTRDPAVYPGLVSGLPALLQEETRAFVMSVFADPGGSFGELLTADHSFVNGALARHYGVDGVSGDDFVRVDMPGRSGVLTQGMLLTRDKATRTSIVRRGLKVRTDLLCGLVPAPPNDVQLDLEGLGEGLSQRERLERHRTDPTCAGCHQMMDPIGVVFESFDAVGRSRTTDEDGKPVDTSSTIAYTRDIDGPVANAAELGQRLAESEEARACYVLQNFRFFYGRDRTDADRCSMASLSVAFQESGYSLSELVVALTRTDAFRYRPVIHPERP
ncbi:hypothetical protein BE20_08385 [Sorangium cellulosum]|uniref:Uncharacterized protein n=1 Tax=Sorangium cellulosum TaxID=56 RepID=A0A150S6D5_SORCE|nr:hypothetical protein BE18_38945 [Sorangium cellulosum]KYF93764.1 hypothetical protein BE20_08385 [Sorangium cellulosum]